jgi:hypothetical protein
MEEVVESAIWCKAKGALLVGIPPLEMLTACATEFIRMTRVLVLWQMEMGIVAKDVT